ncbi:MAG: hypothetical protein HQK62_08690, partial [Desulfamplus sp.]|nr:hypothetical protein [Desulfamplus sp.]
MKNSDKQLIGLPVKSDNSFTHKARMLQGWYRAFVLKIPQGYGPTKNSRRLLPNMIPCEEGILPQSNFLNKMIYDDVIRRIKRTDI